MSVMNLFGATEGGKKMIDVGRICVTKKDNSIVYYYIKKDVLIGRGEECDIRVKVKTVSRVHCKISIVAAAAAAAGGGGGGGGGGDNKDKEYQLENLSQVNLTEINYQEVQGVNKLRNGDVFTVGDRDFVFQIVAMDEDEAAEKAFLSENNKNTASAAAAAAAAPPPAPPAPVVGTSPRRAPPVLSTSSSSSSSSSEKKEVREFARRATVMLPTPSPGGSKSASKNKTSSSPTKPAPSSPRTGAAATAAATPPPQPAAAAAEDEEEEVVFSPIEPSSSEKRSRGEKSSAKTPSRDDTCNLACLVANGGTGKKEKDQEEDDFASTKRETEGGGFLCFVPLGRGGQDSPLQSGATTNVPFSNSSKRMDALPRPELVEATQEKTAVDPAWQKVTDTESGRVYWWNTLTDETTEVGAPQPRLVKKKPKTKTPHLKKEDGKAAGWLSWINL